MLWTYFKYKLWSVYATLSLILTVIFIRHSTDSNFCPFCIRQDHIAVNLAKILVLHESSTSSTLFRTLHPGGCTSVSKPLN